MALTTGALRYVYESDGEIAEVPAAVVTVTSIGPAEPAGAVAET